MSEETPSPALHGEQQQASLSLAAVLKEARINEEKLIHLQTMEMKLLSADSFYEVCHTLTDDYRRQFNLRAVTLTLIDRGQQLHRYLQETEAEDASHKLEDLERNVFFVSDYEDIARLQSLRHAPVLTQVDEPYERFFGEYIEDVESLALLPLVRKGELIGYLALGSVDPDRYNAEMATDFIRRLASIVAVCVQNAIHLEQVKLMSLVDPLTGLRNRRYFFKRLSEELRRAQRHGEQLSCLYIDIDNFKSINDQYGHGAGDAALMQVAVVIDKMMREADICARIGGEEFAVILPATTEDGGVNAAERLLQSLRQTPCALSRTVSLTVTASIGVASCNTDKEFAEADILGNQLLAHADQALSQAKTSGKNRLQRYSQL